MVSAWPERLSAKPAEPSVGVCDGQEALALCTSETPPNWRLIDHKSGWRADVVSQSPSTLRVLRAEEPPQARISDIAN
jgi:hypothetical protein